MLFSNLTHADVPKMISYQGQVTDDSGVPVADGDYDMAFSIHDAVSGGNLEWSSGSRSVTVTNGVFNVLLGESIAIDLEFDEDYWLEVEIEGDTQSPRQPLGSVGYAYMASGLVAGTEVIGSVTSAPVAALKGLNTCAGFAYGLYGEILATEGSAVYGRATNTSGAPCGGRFESRADLGIGVYGRASASEGFAYGVRGSSAATSGRGVYGSASSETGTTYGGEFKAYSPDGYGIKGWVDSSTGITFGVAGQTNSVNGRAVYGHALSGTGECYGGRFENGSTSGRGVFGHAYAGSGTTYGVYGKSDSPGGTGVYYSGGLGGTGAMKAIVRTSQGPTGLDVMTAAGTWVEDFGTGRLNNGHAHIELDPMFRETVTIDEVNPMLVFVQLHDRACEGVAVEKGSTGFDVIELKNGISHGTFDYRVVAKRKGFEDRRLDYCGAAETDSFLFPELRK